MHLFQQLKNYQILLDNYVQCLLFRQCKKLTYVPNSILDPTSLIKLDLNHADSTKIELIDAVNYSKLQELDLSCNIKDWLPMIESFTSLKVLSIDDECGSLFLTKPSNFFKLFNLKNLSLMNGTSHGSSFPELPLNLESLEVPDLSNLKQSNDMDIKRCCSLQSLQKLPPQLSSLTVKECTSLQDLPDPSMLRDLEEPNHNGSTLKVSLKDSHLQVRGRESSTFSATLQNREIAEDNFVVVYKCLDGRYQEVEAVITNKAEGMTSRYTIVADAYSRVGDVVRGDDITIKSGDEIMVKSVFQVAFSPSTHEEMKRAVKMCGAQQ